MVDAVARVREIEGDRVGAVIRSAQLMASMSVIAEALSSFWNRAEDIIRSGQTDAAQEALMKSFAWDAPLLKLGVSQDQRTEYRTWLTAPARINVEAMLARVYVTRLPLSQQVYKTSALTNGWVERRINSAIARGEPVEQLTREVRDFINPHTAGGATYAAKRLARTEINAAYHATVIGHNADKPWNTGMRWRLSGSHPKLDECDGYARHGVFPRDNVPPKPHPQCLCYVTPETVSADEFLRALNSGEYSDWIRANYGG
jgi:hypothetical protein